MRQPELQRRARCVAHGLAGDDAGRCVLCRRDARDGGVPWSWLTALAAVVAMLALWYLGARPVAWLDGVPLPAAFDSAAFDGVAFDPEVEAPAPIARYDAPVANDAHAVAIAGEAVDVIADEVAGEGEEVWRDAAAPAARAQVVVVVHPAPPPAVAPPAVIPRAAGGPRPGRVQPLRFHVFRRPDGSGTGELARPRSGAASRARAPATVERRRLRPAVPR